MPLDNNRDYLIYCSGGSGERIVFLLYGYGIMNIRCFIDNSIERQKCRFLGLPVYSHEEAMRRYPDAYVIISNSIEINQIIGQKLENDGLVYDRDYCFITDIDGKGLYSFEYLKKGVDWFLRNNKTIITGKKILTDAFLYYCKDINANIPVVYESNRSYEYYKSNYKDSVWIILEYRDGVPFFRPAEIQSLFKVFIDNGIVNFSRFFLYDMFWFRDCRLNDYYPTLDTPNKQQVFGVLIKQVVLMIDSEGAGTSLITRMFEEHPKVLTLPHWDWNVFYIVENCINSQMHMSETLYRVFQSKDKAFVSFPDKEKIRVIIDRFFGEDRKYTEVEVLVGIYLIYYEYVYDRRIDGEMTILIEPHATFRNILSGLVAFFQRNDIDIVFLKAIRRPISQLGTIASSCIAMHGFYDFIGSFFSFGMEMPYDEIRDYPFYRYRFEDLKIYPKEMIDLICKAVGIPWDDSLINETKKAKDFSYGNREGRISVRSFDKKPAFDTYENLFSPFDRVRMDVLYHLKNRAYGYSYSPPNEANILKSINGIFSYPWKIEKLLELYNDDAIRFRESMNSSCSFYADVVDHADEYKRWFCFGDYLKLDDSYVSIE